MTQIPMTPEFLDQDPTTMEPDSERGPEPSVESGLHVRGLAARGTRGTRGMTLIEILVVLAIIGLIMGGVGIVLFNALEDSKTKVAAKDIANLVTSVEMYRLQKNKCPTSAQDLKAAGILQKITKDPWNNHYVIKCPGEHAPVDITSAGKDGQLGTDDDINSWDEDLGEQPEKS
jgi:general secretion pathway protein G